MHISGLEYFSNGFFKNQKQAVNTHSCLLYQSNHNILFLETKEDGGAVFPAEGPKKILGLAWEI